MRNVTRYSIRYFGDWRHFHARTNDNDKIGFGLVLVKSLEKVLWKSLTEECYIRLVDVSLRVGHSREYCSPSSRQARRYHTFHHHRCCHPHNHVSSTSSASLLCPKSVCVCGLHPPQLRAYTAHNMVLLWSERRSKLWNHPLCGNIVGRLLLPKNRGTESISICGYQPKPPRCRYSACSSGAASPFLGVAL